MLKRIIFTIMLLVLTVSIFLLTGCILLNTKKRVEVSKKDLNTYAFKTYRNDGSAIWGIKFLKSVVRS